MYLQTTTSRRKNKTYVSYLVRESFRTPQGPRSRTICNVTGLAPEIRELLAEALRGKIMVPTDELEISSALDYGGLAVLRDAWERFSLDGLFAGIASRQRGLLQAMVFARLLFPCSKLALAEQAQGTLLAAACGLDQATEDFPEDDLYAAMDQLNGRWVALEKGLYRQGFTEAVSLVLYDLTSVYFEGKGPPGLSRYGYSRDHRGDRPQILLAVATDTQGQPIHLEVLRGNRGDSTTLQGLLQTLRRRFDIREAVFVFDGGISSRLNLQEMEAQQLGYVTRLSSATLKSLLEELPRDQQPELWDRTQIMEVSWEGRRYVIAGGPWRQKRDAERRAARLAKAEARLEQLAAVQRKRVNPQKLASQVGRALQQLNAHKYFDYWVDEKGRLEWRRKTELIQAEEKLDGWYLLSTNLTVEQCDGRQTLAHYQNLLQVEEAFGQLKSYLEVRPVFHWRPDRVRNHVRICFLAYWISARLGLEWRQRGERGEVPRLLRQLQSIRLGVLAVKNRQLGPKITRIPRPLNDLLKKLGLLHLFGQPPSWVTV